MSTALQGVESTPPLLIVYTIGYMPAVCVVPKDANVQVTPRRPYATRTRNHWTLTEEE